MKKLLTVISCCIFAASVQAQVASSHNRSTTTENTAFSDYNRIEVSYAPISWSENEDFISGDWTGIKVGFIHGKSLSEDMPLYLEYGINAQYAWDSFEDDEVNVSVLNANIPINIAYKYGINNDLHITPYIGVHVRGNILGQLSRKDLHEKTYNFFDKDDMESSDFTANRIQFGAQVGIGFDYKTLHIGVGYNTQFSEYMKHSKTSGYTITLGLNI